MDQPEAPALTVAPDGQDRWGRAMEAAQRGDPLAYSELLEELLPDCLWRWLMYGPKLG